MSDRTNTEGLNKPPAKAREGIVIKADGTYALTSAEEDVLAKVLDEGATTFADMSVRMQSFGRFVLRVVFQGDAGAARSSGECVGR